ncbi:unnamed protein product [Lepeophtheirus salmonis]|uniref:(salmon louse) hypothetical protein n=1 Tax=Lepeophtheirus salmonis TaxID=72036 RepID=A0A7R8H134_LEPSM|nr:unnamed protein product [Lepeophtheirus salmonis]CAF2780979.1 unnamed protein product [Lepeophtheirus salmonis]
MVDAFTRLFGKGLKKSAIPMGYDENTSSGSKGSAYSSIPDVETKNDAASDNGFTFIGDAPPPVDPPIVKKVEPIIPSDAPHMLDGVPFTISSAWAIKDQDTDSQQLDRLIAEVESITWSPLQYNFSIEKSVIEAN